MNLAYISFILRWKDSTAEVQLELLNKGKEWSLATIYIYVVHDNDLTYLIFVILFTLTYFESWKFYTRKVCKFTTNGAQSSNFLVFLDFFYTQPKILHSRRYRRS